jgi:hypothetical protein
MASRNESQIPTNKFTAFTRSALSKDLLITTLLLLVPTLFFWRVSLEGQVLATTGSWHFTRLNRDWNPLIGDNQQLYYPWAEYAARLEKEGVIPLWNPYLFSGMPFIAKGQVGVFYPIYVLLWRVMPVAKVFGYSAILHFFLAGFFTYHFLRALHVHRFGSLVAALAFMLNGFFVVKVHSPNVVAAMVWLPAMLYFFERFIQRRSFVYSLAMGLAVGLSCLASFVTATAGVLFLAGCYSVARLALLLARKREVRAVLPLLLGTGLAFAFGLGIGAVQLIPTYELVRLSHRWGSDSSISFELGKTLVAAKELLFTQVVPEFYGNHIDHNWRFDILQRNIIDITNYIGILPLILAAFAFCCRRDTKTILFSCWAGLAWLDRIGVPVLALVATVFPSQVRGSMFNWGSLIFFLFPLAVLAGLGGEHLLSELARGESPRTRVLLRVLGLVGTITFLTVFVIHLLAKYSTREFSLFYPHQVSDFRAGYQLDSIVVFLFFLVGSTALILSLYKKWLSTSAFRALAVLLILGDLFLFTMDFNPAIEPEAVDSWRWPEVDFLQQDRGLFRILPQAGWYWNNYGAMLFGQQTLLGYDSLYLQRYRKLLQSTGIADVNMHQHHPEARDFSHKLLDLLNVKYLVGIDESYHSRPAMDFVQAFPAATVGSHYAEPTSLELQGVPRDVIAMEPGEIRYAAIPIPGESLLRFGMGMAPWSWDSAHQTDGVRFEVYVEDETGRQTIFSKSLDPTNKAEDRGWTNETIHLSPYQGQTVDLGFAIQPGATTEGDMALWAEPRLVTDWASSERFSLVFSREVSDGHATHTRNTYQNQTCLPRAFVVHDFEVIQDEEALLQELAGEDFDPGRTVLLEETPREVAGEELPLMQPHEEERVDFVSYTPNEVTLEAEVAASGFLILADSFYPGWKAYVDGKETKVYVADYILRSVYLEAGRHVVRFAFEPLSFAWGAAISIMTLAIVSLLLLGLGLSSWMRKEAGKITEKGELSRDGS